jgi:transmembrane sensor
MAQKNTYDTDRILQLLLGQSEGLSVAEQEELDAWISMDPRNPEIAEEIVQTCFVPDLLNNWKPADANRSLAKIKQKLKTKDRLRLWSRIAGAAIILIVVGAGVTRYLNDLKQHTEIKSAYINDIAPGKVGATLTLANGKKIRLADAANGEIAKEAGISVSKTADGQVIYEIASQAFNDENDRSLRGGTTKQSYNTLTTAKGETYILTLPDKSKVWLNAASSLTYSAALNERGLRRVKLEGEAYFQIAKDKAHPFIVESKGQEVEVLGTHFNVNTYADEPAATTTLLEGRVQITTAGNKQVLKPGQQATNNRDAIKVSDANIENTMDWKEGDFYLDRIDFKAAMRKIERWYDVEVIYDSTVPDHIETGGWISRSKKLSSVLKFIESSGMAHFRIEGKKIYVSK